MTLTAILNLAPSSSSFLLRLGADTLCALLLGYALYFRRYRRHDLAFVYVAFNLGVYAALSVIKGGGISLAVGFGLFGILSIIRLRSETFDNVEIGYFFVSLVLALVNGLGEEPWAAATLDVLLLGWMLVGSLTTQRTNLQSQTVTLDRVFGDDAALRHHLEELLGAEILAATILEADYVRDTTKVFVRYRRPAEAT